MSAHGARQGFTYGATDEYGPKDVEGRMRTSDLHATLPALMGLDYEQLTFCYTGRDCRLTDVAGEVNWASFA